MGRKLEWELSGKSDVPQKMAQAKASMEGLDGAANALSKKFKEAFKDIALGFVAPMVLVQKAIGFIADQFAKVQQFAQESKEFAKDAESGKYFRTGGREALIQAQEREDERIKKLKGQVGSFMGYAAFLENDPRGAEILRRSSLSSAGVGTAGQVSPIPGVSTLISIFSTLTARRAAAASMATDPKVRSEIDAILAGDVAKRAAVEADKAAKEGGAKAVADVGSNVIGVGMSPQLDIANRQLVVQEDMANSLRQIIESDQARQGFRTTKQPDFGGAPARTIFPR